MIKEITTTETMKNSELVSSKKSRHSFSEGDSRFFLGKINKIKNESSGIKRCCGNLNLNFLEKNDSLTYDIKLKYIDTPLSNINSKEFVYCGMAKSFPVNKIGMSINNDGELVMVKGKSYDLFKGLKKKITSGYKYESARLNNINMKFKSLYINSNGVLVVDEKETGKSYTVAVSIPQKLNNNKDQYINCEFIEHKDGNENNKLIFEGENSFYEFNFLENNKLFVKSMLKINIEKECTITYSELLVPLKAGFEIINIKRVADLLQLETYNKKNNKRRIIYLNPSHIDKHGLVAKKTSHKAPQTFTSRLGADPHEKYHAGLPFTSDRKGNFSSKYIPLFSSIIDDIRGKIKSSKNYLAEGKNEDGAIEIVKILDPGLNAICPVTANMARSAAVTIRKNINDKRELYDHNMREIATRSKGLSRVANEVLGIKEKNNLSEALSKIAREIKPNNAIHLGSADTISAFFGISIGGLPFFPGWFAGIVAQLANSHNLTISKMENGNINLSFNNRFKTAFTGLAGSGQGMERTLLNGNGYDYFTVMPVEANAIMAIRSITGNDFSFNMSVENFDEFAKQLTNPQKMTTLQKNIIDEAEAKKIKENEFVIMIEAKSELRPQLGSMVNTNTYMVMPRTAVGLKLAIDLLNIKTKAESTTDEHNRFISAERDYKITTLNHNAELFAEWKIMPIAMHLDGNNSLWCYPFPLLEENKTLSAYKGKGITLAEKTQLEAKINDSNSHHRLVSNISGVNHIPVFITIDEKGVLKKGLNVKEIARNEEKLTFMREMLSQIKGNLITQERVSQNKSCSISVISHYELIEDEFSGINSTQVKNNETIKNSFMENEPKSKKLSYRLIRMVFQRTGSLSHVKGTPPIIILSLANINSITHVENLGEILYSYERPSDFVPKAVERRLEFLY